MKAKSPFAIQRAQLQKPVKRSTVKRKKHAVKVANIGAVRDEVEQRDGERCRIIALLEKFGFRFAFGVAYGRIDLAHVAGRGMGGNPDLSRDTAENTLLAFSGLHTGPRSFHSGHLKIRALTDKGANGPCCFEFYEKLPSEL
jgi:hypothetical protein